MTSTKAVKIQGYNCVNCRGPLKSDRTLCSACRGVYYCSKNCQVSHWRANHKIACQLYKHILSKPTTEDLPAFEFPTRVKPGCMGAWLQSTGAIGKGYWRREDAEEKYAYGQLPEAPADEQWGLPSEQLPAPLCHPLENGQAEFPETPLLAWGDYYTHRKLPLNSPISVLLSVPLTLYYAITTLLATHKRIKNKKRLVIFILGPEKELDQLDTFYELVHLIPEVEFSFNLVGPNVPSDMKYESKHPRCSFVFHRGLYHDLTRLPQQPDLAFAPNASIESHSTWRPTISQLVKDKVPSLFTDTTETSTLNATRMFATVGAKEGFQVKLNPFRVPLWKEADVHAMPCYSNGYLQGINV